MPAAENILDSLRIDGKLMACTGRTGLPERSLMIAFFRSDSTLFTRPDWVDPANALAELSVLAATAAANASVSSNVCHRSYRIGPTPNLYDIVQKWAELIVIGDFRWE